MSIETKTRGRFSLYLSSYGLLFVCSLIATFTTYLIYNNTKDLLEDNLKKRLIAIVSTAAVQFYPSDLKEIDGPEAVSSNTYKKIVRNLQSIRNYNENITYVYILRPTENPDIFQYIADADSINPKAIVDLNHDNIIDENDALNTPGDEYDVAEIPELRNQALNYPTTDVEPVADQWGNFLSAYAPIKDKGVTVGIIGIDVEISDFLNLISKTFYPFLLLVIFLLLLLSSMTVGLVHSWQKQVDAVNELDRQKDELLSIVSHQLATPISSLKWYIEMLLDGDMGKISKSQKEQLTSMQQVGGNLADLVSMILDVSRIQLGRMTIAKQEIDLKQFFEEILTIIEPKAAEKKINFHVSIPKEFPKVELDKRYTHMTIENLLSNAVKYTGEGKDVSFDVSIKKKKLYCTVKDNGVGIPKRDQSQIFGKMFRASNVQNVVEGNGFGLYVAKGAIEAQGGRIWFESEEGKGTTFFIELPINSK